MASGSSAIINESSDGKGPETFKVDDFAKSHQFAPHEAR